jgi:hypothetical protein
MDMYLGFQLDTMNITGISLLDITADSFPGYRTWIKKNTPAYNWDSYVG